MCFHSHGKARTQLPVRDPRRTQGPVLGLDKHSSYDKGHLHAVTSRMCCQSHKKGMAGQQNNSSSHQPFPFLSSASRTESARSQLQAREFGKAGQRILECSCELGTFVHTHCPKATNIKQTATYLSALHGLALESN